MPPPLPAGWRLRLAAGTSMVEAGVTGTSSILVGGSPLRVLTLSDRGTRLVHGWLSGQPVAGAEEERVLARRLLDAGLADPDPPARPGSADPKRTGSADPAGTGSADPARTGSADPAQTGSADPAPPGDTEPEVTIVVPVYDDADRLRSCLAPLAAAGAPIIVVDDGSSQPGPIAEVAEHFGAQYVRHPENRGASAARNTGLRMASTPMVAFLDADCVPPPGFPGALLDHLADPALGLVAPRIATGTRDGGRIARYERTRSALDMGPRPALVRPYALVWYVPSAAMVARRSALGAGFDEELRLGEDVDLVWRLHDAGWQVRYEPRLAVVHEDRVRPAAWYRRRVAYNESVAPLLRRHPRRVPVLFLSPVAAFAWGAVVGGVPVPVVGLTVFRAVRLHRVLRGRLPGAGRWAARVACEVTANEARDLARAMAGPWAPFAPLAGRRRLALLLATMIVRDWLADRPSLDPLSYGALRLADESSRGVGIWLGCLRARDFRALLPRRPPPPGRR